MGGIFNDTITRTPPKRRPFVGGNRRAKYLAGKKTDRKVVKHELTEQMAFCDWLRTAFPDINFRCDTSAGAYNSDYEKTADTRQRSKKGLPDIDIYAARRGYHGLLLELKATGEELKMKRDGTKIRVKTKKVKPTAKNPEGIKVIERDYKIRKKGDWKDLHTERQHDRHEELKKAGYCAGFALGLEHAKKITCWYFGVPYTPPPEVQTLF